jgi:hypothetical protein
MIKTVMINTAMTLLRRDPALGLGSLLVRFALPLFLVVQAWMISDRTSLVQAGGPQHFTLLGAFPIGLAVLWFTTLSPLAQGRIRVFEYQLTLPISARKLVGLRLAAHLFPGLALFAVLLLSLLLAAPAIGSRLVLQFAAFSSAWLFCVLSLFAWQPHRPRIDSSKVNTLLAGLGTLALALPFFAPRLALLLTLPSAAWLAIHLWRRVPQTMCLENDHLSTVSPQAAAQEQAGSLNLWMARRTIFRPRFLVTAASVLYFTIYAQWRIGGILFQLPLTVYFTGTMFLISARVLRDFGHLPISRRNLAAWILLPPAFIFLVGTFAGHAIGGSWFTWEFRCKVSLSFDQGDEESWLTRRIWHVQVPGELLQFHWGKEPVLIEAPGGETATIEPKALLWGFPLGLVNPYDVELKSSAEFIAWQLSRAIQQAYGIAVSPETLQAKYMRGKSFSPSHFNWDSPSAKARLYPRSQLVVGLVSNALLWTLALAFLAVERLPARDRARWKWRVAARTSLGILVVGLLGAIYSFGLTHGQIHTKLRRTTEGLMGMWITSHPWLSATLSLAALVAIYRLGLRQIERMEVPMTHPVLDAEG